MIYLLACVLIVAVLLIAGAIYQRIGERRDEKRFPPPGELRDGLHVHERGHGAPAVVLEAGIAASSASWKLVAEPLSHATRVVAYDRAGFGWSAAPHTPRVISTLVEELRQMLDATGLHEPVILAAHSFGGLLARHFAATYPKRVKALVLADPLLPFEWHPLTRTQRIRLGYGVMLSRRGATLARVGVVRFALNSLLSGSVFLPKLFAKASSGPGSSVTDRIVGELRKLPQELWPVMAAHWCHPRCFRTMAEYLERLPANCAEPVDDNALRHIPLIVISAATCHPRVMEGHRALAACSEQGRHIVAEGSGHWVQLDRPDLIVEAVRALLLGSPESPASVQ